MSRSYVPNADPCAPPATPPMTTKSTPARASHSSAGAGSNGASVSRGTLDLPHPARPRGLRVDPLFRRQRECRVEERRVVTGLDLRRCELELLAHQVDERGERIDRRRDEIALDSGDRGLACPGARGELLLRQPMPAPDLPKKLAGCHTFTISDLTYDLVRSRCRCDYRSASSSRVARLWPLA